VEGCIYRSAANKDLPKMTEDLWYHSLKFLDKYRTDVGNYDIEELYQFTDKTGILDRHRQLLIKPFKEHQVDMKIMYYELIKMLIDYERKNQPDTYDSTKTVGKIEGYQELTNKLQRYLNQRFIVDIDQLSKTQASINQVFGGDHTKINLIQKFEVLEEKIGNLEKTNESLVEQIKVLKERDKEIVNSFVSLNNQQSIFDKNQTDLSNLFQQDIVPKINAINESLKDSNKKIVLNEKNILENENKIQQTEKTLTDHITNLKTDIEKNIRVEMEISNAEHRETITNLQNLESKISSNVENISAIDLKLCALEEKTGQEINENIANYQTATSSKLSDLEEKVATNKSNITKNDEDIRQNSVSIANISNVIKSVEEQITTVKSASETSWKMAEEALESQNATMIDIRSLVDMNKERVDGYEKDISSKVLQLQENIETLQKDNDKTSNITKDNSVRIAKVESLIDGLGNEFETSKDRLRKNVDDMQNVNKSLNLFESRHVETVERMKEVTMLVSTMESSIQTQEQRFLKQTEENYSQLNNNLQEIKKNHDEQGARIEGISDDNQMLLEKLNALDKNIDNRLKGIDSNHKNTFDSFQNSLKDNGNRFSKMDIDIAENSTKIKQLEDAYHTQMEKSLYMETLSEKISMMEESRQQTDARVKDEIDSTIKNDQMIRENDKQELLQKILVIDDGLQKSIQSSDTKSDILKIEIDQLSRKLKAYEETFVKLNDDTSGNTKTMEQMDIRLNDNIKELTKVNDTLTGKTNDIENMSKENLAKLIKMEEENRIQKIAIQDSLTKKGAENETKLKQDIEKITENNMNILNDFKSNVEKQIHDLTLIQNNNLLEQKNEINQSIQNFESNIQTMNNTVVNMKQETFAMTSKLDSDFEGTFNNYKDDVERNFASLRKSIADQVNDNLSQNDEKVKEAENHVKNLRDLNGKLIEQVKENLSAHGQEQESIIKDLQLKNENFLQNFHKELEKEIGELNKKAKENTMAVEAAKSGLEYLTQKFMEFDGDAKWQNERDSVIENIQSHNDQLVNNKTVVESISTSIIELDVRHKETVERMKEIAQLVDKYEISMKDIGQRVRDDQKKDLKSIEKQLNTIYLEYEKMENDMGGFKKEKENQLALNEKLDKEILELKNDLSTKEGDLITQIKEQTDNITSTDNKILKLMEQANTFMVNDVTKMEKIASLELLLKDTNDKLRDLESADVFLQESCRQATEKSAALESKTRNSEEELHKLYNKQQEEIENKLKVQIAALLTDIGNLSEEKNTISNSLDIQKKSFSDQIGKIEDSLEKVRASDNDRMRETQEINERIISLQFQAEKASYVETLASQINQMDESRQKSEAKNKEELSKLSTENAQKLEELLKKYQDINSMFEKEKENVSSNYDKLNELLNGVIDTSNGNNSEISALKPVTNALEVKVENLASKMGNDIAMIISKTDEHKELIERSTTNMSVFSEKILSYEKEQSSLTEVVQTRTQEDIANLREEFGVQVNGLMGNLEQQGNKLSTLEAKLEGTSGQTDRMLEDLVQHNSEIMTVKETLRHETDLIVKKLSQQQNEVVSLEKRFEDMESAQIYESKQFELNKTRMDNYSDAISKIDERVSCIEEAGKEQNSLILAVEKTLNDKFEELDVEVRDGTKITNKEISKIRSEISDNKDSFWTLIVEIYSAFRGSTVILKSEGVVKTEQADVLGVYRHTFDLLPKTTKPSNLG